MSTAEPIDHVVGDARSRLLSAAGPIFAHHGFDRATVREISGAACVNVASVGYYFGDKMGLYREVIRELRARRESRYPAPAEIAADPTGELAGLVHTMLSRMLARDGSGWESQLLMREMQYPTSAFEEIVNESFRPIFDRLVRAVDRLTGNGVPNHVNQQLALSVVGQCLYYRVGRGVIDILIPESDRKTHYDIDALSSHIIAVTLCAAEQASLIDKKKQVDELIRSKRSGSDQVGPKSRNAPQGLKKKPSTTS